MSRGQTMCNELLLEVKDLKVHFPVTRGLLKSRVGSIRAVDGLSFSIGRGETLGLVGESGCGKTTTARAILQLERPNAGKVIFEGYDLCRLRGERLRRQRRHIQMVFQDPYASLNPRMKVGAIVDEPLRVHGLGTSTERKRRAEELFEVVGLNYYLARHYPHELSGGQRQRIGIARALATNPSLVVCDEPTSSLDVSIRAQIINLLEGLQERFGLTYLFISHDLAIVRHISHRIAVMYLGKIVELARGDQLYESPKHPYTRALLSAVPVPDPDIEARRERVVLSGEVPTPDDPPPGCRFHTRCPQVMDVCRLQEPEFLKAEHSHWVACHLTQSGLWPAPLSPGQLEGRR